MYDVVAVSIEHGTVRMMDRNLDEQNAEAVIRMAVMRRGVEEEFFSKAPAGKYKDGDKWKGPE